MKRIKSRRIKKCRGFKRLVRHSITSLPLNHGEVYQKLRNELSNYLIYDNLVSDYNYDFDLMYEKSDNYRIDKPKIDELESKIKSIEESRSLVLTQFLQDLINKKYKVKSNFIRSLNSYIGNDGKIIYFRDYRYLVSIQDKLGQYYKFTDENFYYELVKTEGPTITDISYHLLKD